MPDLTEYLITVDNNDMTVLLDDDDAKRYTDAGIELKEPPAPDNKARTAANKAAPDPATK